MKPRYLILFLVFTSSCIVSQCKKDINPIDLLPPVTDTGANTFGCLVNGLAMLPRDGVPNFDNPYPHKGIDYVIDLYNNILDLSFYNARDKGPKGFFLDLHLVDFKNLQPGNYMWQQSTYGVGTFPYQFHHLYGILYDNSTKQYEWFGSYDNSGTTTIIRIDTLNHIVASTFSGKLREKNGTKEISISGGRFDINWRTVLFKEFR